MPNHLDSSPLGKKKRGGYEAVNLKKRNSFLVNRDPCLHYTGLPIIFTTNLFLAQLADLLLHHGDLPVHTVHVLD